MTSAEILFVEGENATVGPELQSRVRRLGYSVIAVVSLEEWTQGSTGLRPDVALVAADWHTDQGPETIGEPPSHFAIPVVYLVENVSREALRREAGASPPSTLTRPFDDEELSTAIEMALHSHAIEEALRESERRCRFLAQDVSDFMWTTDLDMRLTDGDPSVSRLLGCSIDEILGEKMTERLTPASRGGGECPR
jgi:PAS domain-containing protein